MPSPGRVGRCWAVALSLAAAGCDEELGPEPFRTATVRGSIRVAGRPVSGGWVEFLPAGATLGMTRTAPLKPDGTFSADRVPVGQVVVGLAHSDPGQDLFVPVPGAGLVDGRAFFYSFASPIRRTIPPDGLDDLAIDLADEAVVADLPGRSGGR